MHSLVIIMLMYLKVSKYSNYCSVFHHISNILLYHGKLHTPPALQRIKVGLCFLIHPVVKLGGMYSGILIFFALLTLYRCIITEGIL